MKMEYDVFIETENGLIGYLVSAKNRRDLTAKLKKMFPGDHGADAVATDPETGDQFGINW
tara:strand:- start:478 stop:657 length:180 start_codon:yes stop_codon:yes gene_type:complete